ncbi:nucleotidyltransferase domain-containing protein [Desulfomicrobium sp. ZS1]|jgi:predicted nucleotidyltransferase|uniref:nucleotidyltransferase family protein n=1 Tax=Desulfomicrobium sp. ZS1 TaxID=2952228 RepID=UPI0020B29EE5|nr:nucleotidyltransferase domain-containing protein [Desulfomicrobium sp. ZS1]UTF50827.1 nucleotidyltransferase domain-containing protein [Desulfomicrobium sp. ZS1]
MNAYSGIGLLESDLILIARAATQLPEIHQVILFGSRAKGTHKPGSDVDLAIKGKNLAYESAIRLASLLNEESPMPYFFDVVNYDAITEPQLLEHIDRVGVVIFERR